MTFDLEKARKLTYRASAFKIWTPPGGTGYGSDINKHREWQAVVEICDKRYPEALDQITDLMQNCNDLRSRAQKAEAEIERLQKENLELQVAVLGPDSIRAHQAGIIKKQAARIKELEELNAALMKNESSLRAAAAKYRKRAQAAEGKIGPDAALKKQWDEVLDEAAIHKKMEELPSAPGAYRPAIREEAIKQLGAKPRSWQITDERKAALKRLYGLLVIRYKYSYPDETETLRAMLERAGQ